jgi:hypothetical protein
LKTCWNRPREVTDYYFVDCEEYREALSAHLDDEEGPDDARHRADLHLEHCADCALWYDNAALITRRTRTTVAVTWPDVADAVLAQMREGRGSRPQRRCDAEILPGPSAPARVPPDDDQNSADFRQCRVASSPSPTAARRR